MNSRFSSLFFSLGAAAILAISAVPSTAHAIFASVKSTGMAATSISYPVDSFVAAYNPGGIADIEDRLDLEAGWVQDWGSSTTTNNPNPLVNGTHDGMKQKASFPFGVGINKTWCLCEDWRFAFDCVLYTRNYQKTTYKKVLPLFGTSKPGLEYLNGTVSPTVAVQWCNSHTIGISINYQLQRFKIDGIQNFAHSPLSLYPDDVTNRGYDYSSGWGWTIGYYGHITDSLAIGVTYQPETQMKRLNKYKGFLAEKGKLNIPRKIGFGVSFRVVPCFIVAFDVEQLQWSHIKALHNNLQNASDQLNPLGANNGPGFGWDDQWFYRLGVEWEFNEMCSFRVGYRHASSPIEKSQTPANVLTLDTVEDFLTAGGTWYLEDNMEFSACLAYGFEHEIHGKNVILPIFGGGDVCLKEQKFAVGLAFAYKF